MIPSGLLLLADARFPAGGHAHSAGTESAVSLGDVRDPASLERYLHERLATTGWVDASFAAATCAASHSPAEPALVADLGREYSARIVSPYLETVSRRQGRQLVRAAARTWSSPTLDLLAGDPDGPHHALVLGAAAASVGADAAGAATVTVHHLAGAVTTAAVRLLGLDPIEVAALHARAVDAAVEPLLAERPWDVDDLADLPAVGGALTEILGERHGSLDARLFVA